MVEGQGIPDPWLTHSGSDHLEFPSVQRTHSKSANIKKNIFQYLRGESYNGNSRGKPCFCCEKKFLFDCPDKSHSIVQNEKDKANLLNCPCLECHGGKEKTTTTTPVAYGQHCNCIPIFQNWLLEHPDLRHCKNVEKRKRIPSDLSSTISSKYNADEESSTESLYPANYCMGYCSCLQNKHKNVYFDYYNFGMPFKLRTRNQKGVSTDSPIKGQCNRHVKNGYVKSFLCPCLLNFKCAQRDSQNKPEDTNLRSSKEVQTDDQPLTVSKTIQTDKTMKCKTEHKNERKCSCDVKWVGSDVIHRDPSNPIFNPQTGQSFTMCFSHSSLVCPYPHPNQFFIHHVDHTRKCKKNRRNGDVDKALQFKLSPSYLREEMDSPIRTKPKEVLEIKNYLTRPERGLNSCRPIIESFDHSKYLAEERIKKFLQEREFPPERKFDFQRKIYGTATNRKKFEDERTTFRERKSNYMESEVSNPVFHHKNHFVTLPQEINHNSLGRDESHDLNPSVRNSQTGQTFKRESPVKVNFLKPIASNESRIYGLVGHCKSKSCNQVKKRRNVTRKGRRKPLRVTCPRAERSPISKSFPDDREPNNGIGQLDQTNSQQGEVSPKTVSDDNQKASGGGKATDLQFLSVGESSPSKKNFHTFTDTRARNEEETMSRQYGWNGQRHLLETCKKPLKSELNFNNILQHISSHNSATTWSSDTLKSIVDELLLQRKTFE